MNWIDTFALAVVVASAIIAFARGFITEALGIAAWIGAYFISLNFAFLVQPMLRNLLGSTEFGDVAAYGAVFLVGLVFLSFVTGMIGAAVRNSALGGMDRTLGIVFGIARAIVILAAIYVFTPYALPMDRWPEAVAEARSLPHIYSAAQWLVQFVPPAYRPPVHPPPAGRSATAAELLHATPQGRATGRP